MERAKLGDVEISVTQAQGRFVCHLFSITVCWFSRFS